MHFRKWLVKRISKGATESSYIRFFKEDISIFISMLVILGSLLALKGLEMDIALLSALDSHGKAKFESAINAQQGDISAAAARLSFNPRLRLEYSKRIKEMAADLRAKANIGIISWEEAAMEAQEIRNLIMDMVRTRSTPLCRAMAERIKKSGLCRDCRVSG